MTIDRTCVACLALTAPHAVATVEAAVAGAATDGNVPTNIAERRVPHHLAELSVDGAGRLRD